MSSLSSSTSPSASGSESGSGLVPVSVSASITASGPAARFSFSSSSSPLSSPVASSSGSGSSGGDAGTSGSPSISRSSSLLFGFLITFLALFVGFMACGYSSRRAAHARRGEATRIGEYGYHRRVRMKKPHLWDVWVVEGEGEREREEADVDAGEGKLNGRAEGWKSMLPLSASMLQPGTNSKTTPPMRETSASTPEYSPSYILGARGLGRFYSPAPLPSVHVRRPPHEITMSSLVIPPSNLTLAQPGLLSRFRRPLGLTPASHRTQGTDMNSRSECPRSPSARDNASDPLDSTQAQISVLIAMPSPTATSPPQPKKLSSIYEVARAEEAQDDRPRGNYEIGIARVRVSSSSSDLT